MKSDNRPKAPPQAASLVAVATGNAHKVPEIIQALEMPSWSYQTMRELGLNEQPVEDAESFLGNALIKARYVFERTHLPTISDDSGLVVDALDGAPGVYSSRYAGQDASDSDNVRKLLTALADVPAEQRTARFVCAVVFIASDASELIAEAICEGLIATKPSGEAGFGYDPIFLPADSTGGKTMAELSFAEKNAISHRGRALRALRAKLGDRLL
jgi:XTP/dITP diphosphohydrolase